jgi:L-alanine-DL-glutamate epimerase-like enolase superfamily enzyme
MINAIGAIDIALHDLRGRALDKPAWSQLGVLQRASVKPYASLQPDVAGAEEYGQALIADVLDVQRRGFTAVKISLTLEGPYAHKGTIAPWDQTTEILSMVRKMAGHDLNLMVDVQYAFTDVDVCIKVLREWEEFDLYFVEAPLWPDDLDGYERLRDEQPLAIAGGEWLTTRFEFEPFLARRLLAFAQPDIGRVGGLTEAFRVAKQAESYGAKVIPHLWKTGLSIGAALQLAAVTESCDLIEFLPAELGDSALRRELTTDFEFNSIGELSIPTSPGTGVLPIESAIERFSSPLVTL